MHAHRSVRHHGDMVVGDRRGIHTASSRPGGGDIAPSHIAGGGEGGAGANGGVYPCYGECEGCVSGAGEGGVGGLGEGGEGRVVGCCGGGGRGGAGGGGRGGGDVSLRFVILLLFLFCGDAMAKADCWDI